MSNQNNLLDDGSDQDDHDLDDDDYLPADDYYFPVDDDYLTALQQRGDGGGALRR